MSDRMKPVEAAKKLGIPPQRVYNLIKQGRVKTFSNPSGGKVALIDFSEVKIVLASVRQRGPRKEKGKGGTALPGLRRGSIVTHDKFPIKGAFARPDGGNKSVRVVTHVPQSEAGTLVWLSDGTIDTHWGVESLADKLQKHTAQIERPEALLGMVVFSWRTSEKEEERNWADQLESLLTANGLPYHPITAGKYHEEEPEEEPEAKQKVIEVEIPEGGLDLSKIAL